MWLCKKQCAANINSTITLVSIQIALVRQEFICMNVPSLANNRLSSSVNTKSVICLLREFLGFGDVFGELLVLDGSLLITP